MPAKATKTAAQPAAAPPAPAAEPAPAPGVAAPPPAAPPQYTHAGYNADLLSKVGEAKQVITGDHVFEGIHRAAALDFTTDPAVPVHMRSPRRAFNAQECMASLRAGMKYECGMNIFWLSWFESLTSMAPIPQYKLNWLQEHFFSQIMDDFPWRIFVVVKTGENPDTMRGALQVLSPLELIWSFIMGVGRLLSSGISEDDKLVLRKATLTVPVEIHTIDDLKSRLFKCHALREGITQAGESVRRSATARMMDIIESKRLLDSTMTGEQLEALWAQNTRSENNRSLYRAVSRP